MSTGLRHALTRIDEQARTATCAVCGPETKIWKGGARANGRWISGRWRCSGRVKAQVSRDRREDPKRAVIRKLRGNGVDITAEQYDALAETQDGLCAICRSPMEKPQTDHCHKTGVVRGLLCVTCNTGLGKFGDDPERLRAAAIYLERYAART